MRNPRIDRTNRGGGLPGLVTEPVSDDVAAHFGIQTGTGEWVTRIRERSAAARTQLRVRDIILAIDGTPLARGSLHDELERRRPASSVTFEVLRPDEDAGYRKVELQVKIGRARR